MLNFKVVRLVTTKLVIVFDGSLQAELCTCLMNLDANSLDTNTKLSMLTNIFQITAWGTKTVKIDHLNMPCTDPNL